MKRTRHKLFPKTERVAVRHGHRRTRRTAAITSQPQRVSLPLALKLESAKLAKPSWVKISQVRTLSAERLGRCLGRLSAEELDQVIEGLFELVA